LPQGLAACQSGRVLFRVRIGALPGRDSDEGVRRSLAGESRQEKPAKKTLVRRESWCGVLHLTSRQHHEARDGWVV